MTLPKITPGMVITHPHWKDDYLVTYVYYYDDVEGATALQMTNLSSNDSVEYLLHEDTHKRLIIKETGHNSVLRKIATLQKRFEKRKSS